MKYNNGDILKCVSIDSGYVTPCVIGDLYILLEDCDNRDKMVTMRNLKTGYLDCWYLSDFISDYNKTYNNSLDRELDEIQTMGYRE